MIDQKEIFKRLVYLKNVNISYELLDGLSSIFMLKNSIYGTRKVVKELGGRKFYQAIYFVYDPTNENLTYSLQDCFKVLYLLRWNIPLNLKNGQNFEFFDTECDKFILSKIGEIFHAHRDLN